MSKKETVVYRRGFVMPWLLIFVCAKFAGLAGFPTWSWWWILFPPVPVITEILKAIF